MTRELIVLNYERLRLHRAASRHGVTVVKVDEISGGEELRATVEGEESAVSALASELGFDP